MWTKGQHKQPIKYANNKNASESEDQYSSSSEQQSPQKSSLRQKQYKPKNEAYSYSDSQQNQSQKEQYINQASHSIDQDSDEQDSLQNYQDRPYSKLQQLKQDSNQEEQQSIDYIEQRIKKLERDLQDRLDKHKTKSKQVTNLKKTKQDPSQASGKIISIKKQPPLPIKKQIKKDDDEDMPQTQMNFKAKDKSSRIHQNEPQKKQYKVKERQAITIQNKSKLIKQNNPQSMNILKKTISTSPKCVKKMSKVTNKIIKPSIIGMKIGDQLKKINKQVNQLKKQNKYLREELNHYKRKKKPIQQLVKLKELSEHDTQKLQKQFQLLKILQKLQNKLKNSIQRKLGKGSAENKQSKQNALLHKGLPSNILD